MQKLTVLGAGSDEVTGSCYLVTAENGKQILVDFGMFQGTEEMVQKNYELLDFNPASLEAVFLTHGHLDHSGRLPLLIYGGFMGHIYMTEPTLSFIEIILSDSARIAEKDLSHEPLYTADEVRKVLSQVRTVSYDTPIATESFKAIFRDAGHILGSASIELTDLTSKSQETIVFSGDLGNTPQELVRPTELIDSAEYVVMESTYGDSSHPEEDPSYILQEEINAVEKSGGVLIIPAFALERTQEVLHRIHHLKKAGKVLPETPVFLDSPMGIEATQVYLEFKEFFSKELREHPSIPFNFEGLVITDDARDSRDIETAPPPKVIIAGSGMMSGGRVLHHALNYLALPTTRVLFVGYQAEETLGRDILEGAQNVVIDGEQIKVRAHIREIKTLSSHADQPRLLTWLGHIKGVKKVFLTHGEAKQRQALMEKIENELHLKDVILPHNGQDYELNESKKD